MRAIYDQTVGVNDASDAASDDPSTDDSDRDVSSELRIWWLGHATCVIDIDGVQLITDPVLRNHLWHLRRRGAVPDLEGEVIDGVLISHAHHDHLDLPSLRNLHAGIPMVAPPGADRVLRTHGMSNVVTLHRGDVTEIGDVRIEAVFALHEGTRTGVRPTGDEQAVGYVIRGPSGRSVYFAGDTDHDPALEAAAGCEVALLPVGGWWKTLGPEHMTPERAVDTVHLLRPKHVVPIHWGTFYPVMLFRFVRPIWSEPPARLTRLLAAAHPEVAVTTLRPGEVLRIPSS